MNTNPYASLPTTRLQSETDLASLLDSNLQILSLFHSSSTTTTNTSSSSPINSHYDDDDNLDTKKDESDSLINGNFLDFISYQDENLLPIINNDNKSQQHLQIQILGVPNKGAKSRVETQIKLCIQLRGENEKKVLNWSYIRLNENMIAKSKLRKNYQQSTLLLLDGSTMISDESKVLQLDAKVICASKSNTITDCHQQSIRMCMSCVRRERKRADRSNKKSKSFKEEDGNLEAERDRILLFNCNPLINFSSGDAILPTRITCYCRHHNEKVGFRICFSLKDNKGNTVAKGISPPIMITDDHKSSKKLRKENIISLNQSCNRKRSRKGQSLDNSHFTLSHSPLTPVSSRRSSITKEKNPIVAQTGSLNVPFMKEPLSHASEFITLIEDDTTTTTTTITTLSDRVNTIQREVNQSEDQSPFMFNLFQQSHPTTTTATTIDYNHHTSHNPTPQQQEEIHEDWPFNRRRKISHQEEDYTDLTHHNNNLNQNELTSSLLLFDSIPQLERLVPSQGPTYGGIEVTLLGSGFYQGLTCLFGDHVATTTFWNENTLVCILPPATHTGPVVVSFKEHPLLVLGGQDVAIFTYYNATNQALLELALQVVGLKMSGTLQDAKQVAMNIVQGDNHNTRDPYSKSSPQEIVMNLLLSSHTSFNLLQTNSSGQTLLHLAVLLENKPLVQILLDLVKEERHKLLNAKDKNQMTALHFAKSKEMIHLLLKAGGAHLPTLQESKWALPSSLPNTKEEEEVLNLFYYLNRREIPKKMNTLKRISLSGRNTKFSILPTIYELLKFLNICIYY